MTKKVVWSKIISFVKDLLLWQFLPGGVTAFLLKITSAIDGVFEGASTILIGGSPLYMWILATIFGIQIVVGLYSAWLKLWMRLHQTTGEIVTKFKDIFSDVSESYESIVSDWKKTFSDIPLLSEVLDLSNPYRKSLYHQIEANYLPKIEDFSTTVIYELSELHREIHSDASDVSDLFQEFKNALTLKKKLEEQSYD